MIKCPHCGKQAMTFMRKSGLGPGRVIGCASCGKPVTTHSVAVLAAIPAFLGGVVFLRSTSTAVGIAAIVAGVLAMALIQTFLVPLVRADR